MMYLAEAQTNGRLEPRFDAKQNHQGLQLVLQGSLEPSETPAAETPLLAAMAESNDTTQHSTAV